MTSRIEARGNVCDTTGMRCWLLAILLLLTGCPGAPMKPVPVKADRIDPDLTVIGMIVTNDPARPLAEAVAVRDGKIVLVGSLETVDAHRTPATRVVGGEVVLPGEQRRDLVVATKPR